MKLSQVNHVTVDNPRYNPVPVEIVDSGYIGKVDAYITNTPFTVVDWKETEDYYEYWRKQREKKK